MKAEIRKSWRFRFDWFFKSRTPQVRSRYCPARRLRCLGAVHPRRCAQLYLSMFQGMVSRGEPNR